jgi:hypothetical protein
MVSIQFVVAVRTELTMSRIVTRVVLAVLRYVSCRRGLLCELRCDTQMLIVVWYRLGRWLMCILSSLPCVGLYGTTGGRWRVLLVGPGLLTLEAMQVAQIPQFRKG